MRKKSTTAKAFATQTTRKRPPLVDDAAVGSCGTQGPRKPKREESDAAKSDRCTFGTGC